MIARSWTPVPSVNQRSEAEQSAGYPEGVLASGYSQDSYNPYAVSSPDWQPPSYTQQLDSYQSR